MIKKLKHYFRRMKYLAWIEWLKIIKGEQIPHEVYLVGQRELTQEELDYANTLEPTAKRILYLASKGFDLSGSPIEQKE